MVHGSFTWGEDAWTQQRELADRYRLLVLDRCGYGHSPNTERFGFEEQADDIADLLGKASHLVGSSYGAVLALVVAQSTSKSAGCDRSSTKHNSLDPTSPSPGFSRRLARTQTMCPSPEWTAKIPRQAFASRRQSWRLCP